MTATVLQCDREAAERWATDIGKYGGVILDQSQREGLARRFARHRIDSTREMVEALKAVRADLCNENRLNTQSIADVIWHTDIETTVDFIDATLQGTDR